MKHFTYFFLSLLFAGMLNGCGGGSSSGGGSGTTTLTGVVAKGLFTNGNVKVYAIVGGVQERLLGQATISSQGGYTFSTSSYSGPVMLVATGKYLDEISGLTLPATGNQVLRAAVPNATGTMTVCITPLTEVAVYKAENRVNGLTPQNIAYANDLIENIFKISDILQTIPVAYTTTGLPTAATTEAAEYTMLLAAISKLAQYSSADAVIDDLKANLAGDVMSPTTASNLNAAVDQLPLKAATSDLTLLGTKKVGITVRLQSTLAAINLVNLTLIVPTVHNIPTINTGTGPAYGVVDGYITTPATITTGLAGYDNTVRELYLVFAGINQSFANGDLFTAYFDLPAGEQPATNFFYKDLTVLGINQSSTSNTLTARDTATGDPITITLSIN
jgi:hypothetical protein